MSAKDKTLNSHIPAIRFKGVSGAWEKKALGENANFSKGRGYSKSDLVAEGSPIILYGRLYTRYQVAISEVDTFVIEANKSILSNGNEVIVPASGETADDIARASTVLRSGIVLGGDLNIIYPNNKIESLFLALTISNGKPQKDLSKRAQGKSVVHVRNDDLKEIEISYPDKTEQTKISKFFQQLDTLITQHQHKHDKLLDIKKSLLEKMFPKQGEFVPAIRFKGFSGAWKAKALGNFTDITTGKLNANAMVADGDYDFFTSGIKKYKINFPAFKGPAITIAGNGATVGYTHLADDEFNAYQRTYVLTCFTAYRYFLYFQIGNVLPIKISQEARAGNIPYIVLDMLTDLAITIPSEVEQIKIGNFFKQLNTLISQYQSQLKKLDHIKRACLAQMFV